MRRTLSALVVTASIAYAAQATTIVWVRYPSGHVVAADSRRENYNTGSAPQISFNCKLRHTHSVIAATSETPGWGVAQSPQGEIPDVREESDLLLKNSKMSAEQMSKAMKDYVSSPLFQEALVEARRRGHATPAGDWVFVDAHSAWTGSYEYGSNLKVANAAVASGAIGATDDAKPYIDLHLEHEAASSRESAIDIARQAIKLQSTKRPDVVGGQISIATMDRSGSQWVERGLCNDVSPR
jgi:hypothetical protein